MNEIVNEFMYESVLVLYFILIFSESVNELPENDKSVTHRRTDGQTDGRTDGRMDGQTNGECVSVILSVWLRVSPRLFLYFHWPQSAHKKKIMSACIYDIYVSVCLHVFVHA